VSEGSDASVLAGPGPASLFREPAKALSVRFSPLRRRRTILPRVPNAWVRRGFSCAAVLSLFLVATAARADLRITWDCYLPNAGVDCSVLESSLTSKIPFLKIVSARGDADVVTTVTSLPSENGTRFKLDFVGKPVDGYTTEVHTFDKIPSTVDSTTATVRILTKLERGLDDFMDQKLVAEMKAGTLDLQLTDPSNLPFVGRPEQTSLKWYVAPILSTYFSDVEGVGINASGSAGVSYNYSERNWRVQQGLSANYSRQSQPVPGTNETASIQFVGGNATNVLSWSLGDASRWSLGVLLSAEKNPQANYTYRANGSAGVEFDLVPRQTVDQKNFGFRCAVGPEFQRYDATNIEGLQQQLVGRQFCDVFLNWHFDPADVNGSLGETSVLEDVAYRSFSATLGTVWRVTDNFLVSPWVVLQQINKAINEGKPTNTVYKDPRQEIEASMLAAVQQGYTAPFGIQAGLWMRYLFGNGSLNLEDQRWKAASNLR
jgi:hypothetical protein